jgi:hypothetical protein
MPPLGYKKWNGVYRKIMLMHEKNMDNIQIGKVVGMHPATISDIVHSPRFVEKQKEFELRATEKARKLFEDSAVDSAKKIIKISKDGKPEERIQFDAAKEILYQVGVKPVEVIETRKREYTPAELESALEVTREVEAITERLGKTKSQFLLEKTDEPTASLPAPVVISTDGKSEGENVRPKDSLHQTSPAG